MDSLKRQVDGRPPLDAAIDELRTDPSTVFHLMPLPMSKVADKPTKPTPTIRKDQSPKRTPSHNNGKGKGKGRFKNRGKMPVELVGLNQTLKSGKRISYNFNLSRDCTFAEAGKDCNKGCHVCMPCFGPHPVFLNTLDRYMTCAKFAFTAACMERLGRSTQNFCAIIQPFTPRPDSVMEHTHISLGAILEPNGLLHLKLNTHMRCATPLLKFATASCWRWASLMCPRKCSRITSCP